MINPRERQEPHLPPIGMNENPVLDKYEFPKGILDKDKFFAGLEEETKRVNRKMGVLLVKG